MQGILLALSLVVCPCQVKSIKSHTPTQTYDDFFSVMNGWASAATGAEKARRQHVMITLSDVMAAHNFRDQGTTFSQFQRFLKKPYNPNMRDIYYVLNAASGSGVSETDVAEICTAAQIPPIQADALDIVLYGLVNQIGSGNLSPLDAALFQSEISSLTETSAKTMTINDYLVFIVSDPNEDCDSILKNLDASGITAFENIVSTAVPGWSPPEVGYDSFDSALTAWIKFKFTDSASQAVVQKLIASQVLKKMHHKFQTQVPFPEFQMELLKTDPVWDGPALYFTLSKFTMGDGDNLPVPTDALEAIYRAAGLDVIDCQPSLASQLYTALLSHQNGGTPGDQLTESDMGYYSNIITYIGSYQGKTVDDLKAYVNSLMPHLSLYAQQDILSIMDPEHQPRPYHYSEDTEYFRNDQKLLPLHTEDPEYYREHVIPSLGIGKYNQADNVGRYRYLTGKGGELYLTVHYNHFLRVDQLMTTVQETGTLTQSDIASWILLYTTPTNQFYDPQFYKEIQDLAQIAGVATPSLLNLSKLDPAKQTQILTQVTNIFLTLIANPPPPIP